MSTSAITSTSYWKTPTVTSSDSSSTTGTNNLADMDTFLSLLATELQNQDPTDPVSNTEYVSQMAQMSSLMQMQNISASVNATQAYSMIGKTASYETTDSSGNTISGTGTVQSVTTSGSNVYVNIDGNQIDLSAVVNVSGSSSAASD